MLKTQTIASINREEVMEKEREKPKSTVPVLTALVIQSCYFDMKFRFTVLCFFHVPTLLLKSTVFISQQFPPSVANT